MNRSTPDAAVTFDPTHSTYATLGELHLDRERDLVLDVRCGGRVQARRARGALARPPHGTTVSTARCCATYSSRCTTTAGARGYAGPGCVTYRLHSGIRGRVKLCADSLLDGLDYRASTFSLLLLYVVKLYDISVHLDLCARAPRVSQTALVAVLTFSKPVKMHLYSPCALGFIDTAGAAG